MLPLERLQLLLRLLEARLRALHKQIENVQYQVLHKRIARIKYANEYEYSTRMSATTKQTYGERLLILLVVAELSPQIVQLGARLLQRLCQAPVLRQDVRHLLLETLLLLLHVLQLLYSRARSRGIDGIRGSDKRQKQRSTHLSVC